MEKFLFLILIFVFAMGCNQERRETGEEHIVSAATLTLPPASVISDNIGTSDFSWETAVFPPFAQHIQPEDISETHGSPFLDELAKDTFTYISAPETTSNHLPWSWYSDTISGGSYANTAEIGFYALSWLAAYDRQTPWSPNWEDTETEITAVLDQLRVWQTGTQTSQPNGPNAYQNKVFYQWYWIDWNPPVVSGVNEDHLVPSIDNAWLAVSLITIREYAEAHEHNTMAAKANAILTDMDFRLWYDDNTSLFSWGDVENPKGTFIADVYSNENRIINFTARALGQLTKEEFQTSLSILNQPTGTFDNITVDKIAYDGSYFTYTSPALFIQETKTEYGDLTINPATEAQIIYANDQGYDVWGLSDSYDVNNGGYVGQGALPTIAPGSPETRPGLVAPHASAMGLISSFSIAAETNLQAISNYACAYDDSFGFRDSVMTNPDAVDYGQCSSRFSALAQEWIFLSLINYENGFIWRYFYLDNGVRIAHQEMFNEYYLFLPIMISE